MKVPSEAELTAAFAARRCVICDAPADVVCPGSDADWHPVIRTEADGSTRTIRVQTAIAVSAINLCLLHAAERWPWKSERTRHTTAKRTPAP